MEVDLELGSFQTSQEREWAQFQKRPDEGIVGWLEGAFKRYWNGDLNPLILDPRAVEQEEHDKSTAFESGDVFPFPKVEIDRFISATRKPSELIDSSLHMQTSFTNRVRSHDWGYWLHQD